MKKILIITAVACASCVNTFAQQAIWGQMKHKSPEYNEADQSITLRYEAPNAGKVEVIGDLTGYKPVEMTKDADGVWSVTMGPLSSDLYGYSFLVDGLQVNDPNNVYVMRDTNTLTNILIVPGEKGNLYSVNDVPHGTVSEVWYPSESLGMNRRMTVYTPAGYETDKEQRYPVLYLLHGLGGDECAWADLGRVPQILDNMIAEGAAQPMIVVMTNGNSPQQAAPGANSDGLFVQPTTRLPFVSGAFEASFPEVVTFIDSTYRTKADKQSRAIAGLSMGGMHTRAISMNFPELFDYVGLFSAAINPMFSQQSEIYTDMPEKLKAQFENAPKLYWIGIGKDDFLMQANKENRELMDSMSLPYVYHESAGGHTWTNWRDYLTIILPQLFVAE